MTPLQEVEVRLSECRKRLAAIGAAELNDETRAEVDNLRAEYSDLETRSQALRMGGETEPEKIEKRADHAEDLELRGLQGNVHFSNYLTAAMAGHGVYAGAEAEYNQHLGIPDNKFPMELLARGLETRAARDGDSQTMQGTWLDRLFADSAAARLGVSFRDVAPGVASYPVTSAGGSPVQRGRTEAVTESTYTAVITEIKPSRRAVHGIYSIEDDARLPGLSDAIARDMRMAMTENVDKAVFLGDDGTNDTNANIVGLNTATIDETTLTQANKILGPATLAVFMAYVDGLYAASPADVMIVSSVGANVLWRTTVINSAASNETLGAFLMTGGMNWSVRAGIDTNTANNDFGAFVGLGRGVEGAGIAAVWASGELIRDPYGDHATKGEVAMTLNYLWQFAMPRTANFKRVKFVA